MKRVWKHAFEVDPPGEAAPTPEQQVPVDWVCREIARRHLTTPALMFLEMSRPLNYIGSQIGHYFSPAVWAITRKLTYENYQHLVTYLERRGSMDYLCRRIEHFEQELLRKEKRSRASILAELEPGEDPFRGSPPDHDEQD